MEGATGVSGLAAELAEILTLDNFLGALIPLVGVMGGVLVFAFMYRIVRKLIKGAQKGKANI